MSERWMKLAVVGCATALALAMAEGVARWFESQPKAEKVHYLTAYDPELGWRKEANRRVENHTNEFDVVEETNSQGLRGPEIPFEKPEGVYRVLMLGDSFLEGYTVAFDDLVSERLRELLQQGREETVEVVNGGTAGYSTDQELLFYRRDGRRYHPDRTVLLFYVNDVWFNRSERYWRGSKPRFVLEDGALRLTNSPAPPPANDEFAYAVSGGRGLARTVRQADAWMGTRSALYRLARVAATDSPFAKRWLIRAGLAEVPGEWKPWSTRPSEALEQAWAVTEALLAQLRDEVEADGSTFTVFWVPSRAAVEPDDWQRTREAYAMDGEEWDPAEDARMLERICQRQKLDCIVPLERFREAASDGEALYYREDAHWTPRGHALAAEVMAESLRAEE
ncbi:MAG: SGNH/GDSL hydrolase family protein [Acidobacteria bacterium]|nr:SGNH/GDSL hydrolase family protein [Acidobacteriota bacterium]